MKILLWCLVALLFVLHQDVWYWNDGTLVFDFMPIGLAYHALFSLVAGAVWAAMVFWAWPRMVDGAKEGE